MMHVDSVILNNMTGNVRPESWNRGLRGSVRACFVGS